MFDFQIQRLKQKNHSHTKCKLKKKLGNRKQQIKNYAQIKKNVMKIPK